MGVYRLLGRLGVGGMGQVFLGVSPGGRRVAVKLIHREYAGTPQFRERFAREIEAARRVGGFHTAPVVDADPHADPPWMVTAFIDGPSLQDDVDRSGPLPPDRVCTLGAGLAEGLAVIHACGLVHRDLKPGNVVLAADGPRIIDFGIARAIGATTGLTSTGVVVGTLTYMSPEQIRGDAVGPASDVFALGSVLAFAATGRAPFGHDSAVTVMFRICTEPPDLAGVADERLRKLIDASLAKAPQDRPTLPALLGALGGATPAAAPAAPARAVPAADMPAPSHAIPAATEMPTQTQASVPASTGSGRGPLRPPSGLAPARRTEPSHIVSGRAGGGRARAQQRRRAAFISLPVALVILAAAIGWLLTHSQHVASPGSDPQIAATRDTAPASVPPSPRRSRLPIRKPHHAIRPSPTVSASSRQAATPASGAAAAQVLALVNHARAAAGLPPLTITAGLDASATAHNATMAGGCGLSHQCPGEPDLGARETAAGVTSTGRGENIGEGGPEADNAAAIAQMAVYLTQNMLSEKPPDDGHRQNILSSTFTHIGIAVYRDASGTVWLTQDFSN